MRNVILESVSKRVFPDLERFAGARPGAARCAHNVRRSPGAIMYDQSHHGRMVQGPAQSSKRILRSGGLILLLVGLWLIYSSTQPFDLWRQRQMILPPTFDTAVPVFARIGGERHVLLFSKTNGYRHHAAIARGRRALEQIAADHSWFVYITDNAAAFNSDTLQQFDSVVFNNTSGPLFTTPQQQALDAFVRGGGGVHYLRNLGRGASFRHALAGQIKNKSAVRVPAERDVRTPIAPHFQPPVPVSQSLEPQS